MRLNIDALQRVVRKAIDEEKAADALKGEIRRVLGPTVITDGKLEEVAMAANDWVDVLERTGRSGRFDFLSNVTTGFLDHNHPEVRRFAARIVPEQFLGKLTNDKDSAVRAAVAQRVPLPAVREMMKRFKNDDTLRTIYRARKQKLLEGGVSKPKVEPLGHDPVDGAERLGDAAKTADGPELSEAWYDQQARLFLHDYGRNMEYAWEELAVRRFCASTKATSGVEVDEAKLLKSIKELIEEKEDVSIERNTLRETLAWLEQQDEQESLNESAVPFDESPDAVGALVNGSLTAEQYIDQAKSLFRIQESSLPMGIRKYRLGEGNSKVTSVPCIGYLPTKTGGFRSVDERALDRFCEHWNDRQALAGEPIVLNWGPHPGDMQKICFTCTLK